MTSVLFFLQLLVALTCLPLCVLAFTTSRQRRAQQRGWVAMAVVLMALALLGLLLTLAAAAERPAADDWMALSMPIATFVIGGLTIWRASTSRRGRGARSGSRTRAASPGDSRAR